MKLRSDGNYPWWYDSYLSLRWDFNMARWKLMAKLGIGHIFYKKVYSGTCVCTHSADDHHGNMVMNMKAYAQTGESRSPGECEFYGWNECTDSHCINYHDKDDPRLDRVGIHRAADPAAKVGGCP